MLTTLAQSSDNAQLWLVVIGLSSLVGLALGTVQLVQNIAGRGKESERQIEPTALAAIGADLKAMTLTLAKLDREMGGFVATTQATQRELDAIRKDIDGAHQRIGGISRELAATVARLAGLEKNG